MNICQTTSYHIHQAKNQIDRKEKARIRWQKIEQLRIDRLENTLTKT